MPSICFIVLHYILVYTSTGNRIQLVLDDSWNHCAKHYSSANHQLSYFPFDETSRSQSIIMPFFLPFFPSFFVVILPFFLHVLHAEMYIVPLAIQPTGEISFREILLKSFFKLRRYSAR